MTRLPNHSACPNSRPIPGDKDLMACVAHGYGSAYLAEQSARSVTGIDFSAEAVAYCKAHYHDPGCDPCGWTQGCSSSRLPHSTSSSPPRISCTRTTPANVSTIAARSDARRELPDRRPSARGSAREKRPSPTWRSIITKSSRTSWRNSSAGFTTSRMLETRSTRPEDEGRPGPARGGWPGSEVRFRRSLMPFAVDLELSTTIVASPWHV